MRLLRQEMPHFGPLSSMAVLVLALLSSCRNEDQCGAATAPASCIAGEYDLITVDGQTLPARVGLSCYWKYYSGNMILEIDGSVSGMTESQSCCAYQPCADPAPSSFTGHWRRVANDSLELTFQSSLATTVRRVSIRGKELVCPCAYIDRPMKYIRR